MFPRVFSDNPASFIQETTQEIGYLTNFLWYLLAMSEPRSNLYDQYWMPTLIQAQTGTV